MKTLIIVFLSLFSINSLAQERKVVVDLKNFKWQLFEDDVLIREGLASGGRRWCPDINRKCKTPQGSFEVLSKKGRWYRSPLYPVGCNNQSNNVKEKCAAMSFAIKFKFSGESLHASNDNWKKLKHQSHGCVHLPISDAKFLNEYLQIGDKIDVLSY